MSLKKRFNADEQPVVQRAMSYEDFLIREMNYGQVRWCSSCERDAEDCVCEEIADHFRSILTVPVLAEPKLTHLTEDAEGEARESTLGHTLPGVDPDGQTRDSRGGQNLCSVGNAGEDVVSVFHVSPAAQPTSFSDWMQQHGDALSLPQSFTEWLEQTGDKI